MQNKTFRKVNIRINDAEEQLDPGTAQGKIGNQKKKLKNTVNLVFANKLYS